jgi:hypothetical protein
VRGTALHYLPCSAIYSIAGIDLGLPHNSNDRPIPTSRSPSPTLPSIPFSALAGTYRDPGYGVLDLCFVSPESLVTSASESCRQLIDEIPTTLPAVLGPRIPPLLARWNRFEVTHAAFAHFEQNLFSVTAVLSVVRFQLLFLCKHLMGSHQSTGNSSDKPYWVQIETDPSFDSAEFSFEDKVGVGFQGLGVPDEGLAVPRVILFGIARKSGSRKLTRSCFVSNCALDMRSKSSRRISFVHFHVMHLSVLQRRVWTLLT